SKGVRIRAGGQHTGAAVDAAKKFIDLDLQCPPLDLGGAWGGIRARVPAASAFASPWLSVTDTSRRTCRGLLAARSDLRSRSSSEGPLRCWCPTPTPSLASSPGCCSDRRT